MSTSNQNFKSSDANFNVFQMNLAKYFSLTHTEFTMSVDEGKKVAALSNKWSEVYAKIINPSTKTKITVLAKNDARKELVAFLRVMVNKYIQSNNAIIDEIRKELGLTVKDKVRTPVPVPTGIPFLTIDFSKSRIHSVFFGTSDPTGKEKVSRRKPKGVKGCKIAYKIGLPEPTSTNELNFSVLGTNSPSVLDFNFEQVGLTVFYSACWFNEKGETGQWSNITKALIN
ncbi:MAG: hypothetical protein LBB41_03210 [Prevotellaceae bacterium]|jgi:hypothetical protein|nr:hypothetical protein [Prevotellaceae bacterium]